MGALIKLIIVLYLLSLLFSLFVGLIRFLIDVGKWHVAEKKVIITKFIDNERSVEIGRTDNTGDNGTGTDNPGADGNNDTGADSGRTAIEF